MGVPTVTILIDDTNVGIGQTGNVTFVFSEAVSGFDLTAAAAANGVLTGFTPAGDGITFTATFTPNATVADATNLITANLTGVLSDSTLEPGAANTNSNNYAVDTVRPTATIVVDDTALAAGEASGVTITFSEAVTGFTNGDLNVANGTLSAVTTSDNITFTATLTPTAAITDATNLIVLNNAGAADGAGNAGTGTTSSNNYAVDTVRPTATILFADDSLEAGETTVVTFTFSEGVTGFTNAALTVPNGALSTVGTSDGGTTWTATFTPTAAVSDTTNAVVLDNTTVTDAAGNAGVGTTTSPNYIVATVQPTVGIVVADTSLAIGDTSVVTFTFSEAVTGFASGDVTVANGAITNLSSSDGGITWTATLTPATAITDTTNVVTVTNTGYVNADGNAGTGTTDSNTYAVDTVRPTATIVLADSSLAAGETSLVTITFSEAVTGFANADLTIPNGALTTVATSDGGLTYTATFTPTAAITDTTNIIVLDNTGVTDAAGNAGTGTSSSSNFVVDTARPSVAVVVADTTLAIGETSLVTFTFSQAVTGFSNADLTIANGTLTAVSSSDGGTTFTASLSPTAATADTTNVITVANTGYAATAGGSTGLGVTDSNNYAVDTVRPTATIVLADTTLSSGETSGVTITFSEAVTGFANNDLTLEGGTLSAVATSNNITYTATFTPTAALTDATNVITLANGGVLDGAGNAGTGTSASANFAIDTNTAPPPPPPPTPPPVAIVTPGSAAPDMIVGDTQNNLIVAGAGNDTASGGLGGDSIEGDAGDDVVQGNAGNDDLSGGTGNDIVLGGQDNDQVQGNSENDYVSGDKGSDTVHGGQGNDIAYGGEGDDFVFGDRDNDIVRGGQGNDQVMGGDGDDYVSGDRGSDTIAGGLGADLFHTFGDAGMDLVTDFNLAQGDRVILDLGTTYTVSQVGLNTVIDMTGGGQMVLAGVQLSTLTPGWIFTG